MPATASAGSLVLGVLAQLDASAGDDASSRLSMVIAGLVGLAVVIAVVTVVFWRMTRPEPLDESPGLRSVPPQEDEGPFTVDPAAQRAEPGPPRGGDPGPPTAG